MRHFVVVGFVLAGCGAVDAPPLGGPYGGSTDQTDPNSDNPNDPNDTDAAQTQATDSGSQQEQQQDSGTQQQQKDSGTQQQGQDAGQQQQQTAPTWSTIFADYLASNKEGRCDSCHSEGASATKLYSWLQSKGYINGTSSSLVNKSKSCLSWYGGNMPPSGPSDANAVSDMNAWAAAGAANN